MSSLTATGIRRAESGSRSVLQHRWDGAGEGLKGIDVAVGEWATESGTPIWFPTPSLVQHVGHVSTMWKSARSVSERRARIIVKTADEPDTALDSQPTVSPYKFVLLSMGRCGSTLLEEALNAHSQLRVRGEPFCAATEHLQFRDLISTMYGRDVIGPNPRRPTFRTNLITGPMGLLEQLNGRLDDELLHD